MKAITEAAALTQQQKQPRCASLTKQGRPCKLRRQAAWVPFCHTHVPSGHLVECVGGGPLDGLFLCGAGNSYDFVHPEEIIMARVKGGALGIVLPHSRQVHRGAVIGTYREAFTEDDLVLVWQWKAA